MITNTDTTYLRLEREFVYLAVVLDAFSRRAVGWALGRNLQTALPLAALEKAIQSRQPPPRGMVARGPISSTQTTIPSHGGRR